jgi:hypothetical protein
LLRDLQIAGFGDFISENNALPPDLLRICKMLLVASSAVGKSAALRLDAVWGGTKDGWCAGDTV